MQCRVCDHEQLTLVFDLGLQPWANHFLTEEELGTEPLYPLRVVVCNSCQTAQLDYTVKKEVMFQKHTYLSGITRSLQNHFEELASRVDQRFFSSLPHKRILDIGSNDGTQLRAYQKLGYEVLGVESADNIAQIANGRGIATVSSFFNLETARQIGKSFDLINASGVFFHLEELHSVTQAIAESLRPKGVFLIQFLYMKNIMEKGLFDQIYHEHLLYYTLKTLDTLLTRHGLSLFDAEFSPIHGGSVIAYACLSNQYAKTQRLCAMQEEEERSQCNELSRYFAFARQIQQIKEQNLTFLSEQKGRGKKIFGMGAPVKGNTLLNYFGIGKDILDCLVEKNELRRGLFSPGQHLPIRIEKETPYPDLYYVLAWNFKQEILQNHQEYLSKGGQFYFPFEGVVG